MVSTPVDRQRERAVSFSYLSFRRLIFPERGAGRRVLGGFLQSTVLVCMAVGREGKSAALCLFALLPFYFVGLGAGRRFSRGSPQSATALSVCTPAGREGDFELTPFNFPGAGGGG